MDPVVRREYNMPVHEGYMITVWLSLLLVVVILGTGPTLGGSGGVRFKEVVYVRL